VLGSPVQSGFLAYLAKTGTETGPSKLVHLKKPDQDRKRPQNQSFAVFLQSLDRSELVFVLKTIAKYLTSPV